VLIERWRNQYNRRRPHSALGNRPPAPEAYPAPFLRSPLTAATAVGLREALVQKLGAGHLRVPACLSDILSIKLLLVRFDLPLHV
jgi:Integrase core domain